MSRSRAYTVNVGQNNTNRSDSVDMPVSMEGQSSPTWVLTFVRWNVRDPIRTPDQDHLAVRDYMIVENDCISLNVNTSKSVLTPSFDAILKETDVNYATALKPGDFVFINILNSETEASKIVNKVHGGQPINKINDGFKGLFKIQGVRRSVIVDPSSGVKSHFYRINGFAFTEFNNIIYFNPNLLADSDFNQAIYSDRILKTYSSLIMRDGVPFCQELIAALIQSFIGVGFNQKAYNQNGLITTPNFHFKVPLLVGRLLGIKQTADSNGGSDLVKVHAAKDIYQYMFGIQQYNNPTKASIQDGMNPSNLIKTPKYPGFYYTKDMVEGTSHLKIEFWNQVKLWSILNQYVNSPLNEMYSCFRISPTGSVLPTLVLRQIPFTTEEFESRKFNQPHDSTANTIKVTKFLSLPRWKLDPSLVLSADLGTDEAARVNFVQYYARSTATTNGVEIAGETASHNYAYDSKDISRNGLRPYIVQNNFEDQYDRLIMKSPLWARVIGDAVIGGHLKMNGTINSIGIVDPISVGDNLEFEDVVYHIEQIAHSCNIDPASGMKSFKTMISLSNGVMASSSSQGVKYDEMDHIDAEQDLKEDHKNGGIYPGISMAQKLTGKETSDVSTAKNSSPFPQPNLNNKGRSKK
jgi:hypothetical protein